MYIGCFLIYGFLLCYQPVKTESEALAQLQHVMQFPMKEGANADAEMIFKVQMTHRKDRKR
jgi:hypothetical protein